MTISAKDTPNTCIIFHKIPTQYVEAMRMTVSAKKYISIIPLASDNNSKR